MKENPMRDGMPYAEKFEDLEIGQEARRLNREVFNQFMDCGIWFFRDQICRASLSVMNNIAEGFERRTSRDMGHFLDMAKGSSGEVRSMTYAAEDAGLLKSGEAQLLRSAYEVLSRRIAAFHKSLNR